LHYEDNMTTKQTFMVITEEQAQHFEALGIPVDIQYTVRLELLGAAPKPSEGAAAPVSKLPKQRTMKFHTSALLRWTGLKWTGQSQLTQAHLAYNILKAYFEGPVPHTITRRDANNLLSAGFMKHTGKAFNSSVMTYLCNQKYLELNN
jgi:hypothetical protein